MALALAPILMLSIQRYPAIFELYLSRRKARAAAALSWIQKTWRVLNGLFGYVTFRVGDRKIK
jgi:hypothetical protein